MKNQFNTINKEIDETLNVFMCVRFYKIVFVTFLVYLLAISSIIRADYNYIDDLGRISKGYRNWIDFSRYISELGSIVLHGNFVLSDISPLPQLIAVFILAVASSILIFLIFEDAGLNLIGIVSTIPVALSPYFLECLAFKFDSPYMALSVFATIFPFVFFRKSKLTFALAVFYGALIMCFTYQASNGIFLAILLLYSVYLWIKGLESKDLVSKVLIGGFVYSLTLILYQKFLVVPLRSYVTTIVAEPENLFSELCNNVGIVFRCYLNDYPIHWQLLTAFVLLFSLLSLVYNSKRSRIKSFVIVVPAIIIAIVFSQGAFLILEKTYVQPRALYSVWIVTGVITLFGNSFLKYNSFLKCFSIALSWCIFSFCFVYGNALSEQKAYAERRIQMIMYDLNRTVLYDGGNTYDLKIVGSIDRAPIVRRIQQNYPIIERIISVQLYEADVLKNIFSVSHVFVHYPKLNLNLDHTRLNGDKWKEMDFDKVIETGWHDIKISTSEKVVVVVLK